MQAEQDFDECRVSGAVLLSHKGCPVLHGEDRAIGWSFNASLPGSPVKQSSTSRLSKEFKLSKEIQIDATELRIRAERRLGEMLKVMEKNQGVKASALGRVSGGNIVLPPEKRDVTPTLADFGITKND